ncbi:hypothetical protein DH2020_005399 [Rehmannia glutinosa]|uniref:Uncharacterized protein n=1 Tax=Rehmannia glutinosa TaxID=99300 RepID=A0ABR0XFS7_REHGL
MAAAADEIQPSETPPLLLVHRLPRFKLSFFPFLQTEYTVLDPLADPPDPSFPDLSKSARIMLCVGPTPVGSDELDRYPAVECVVGSSAGLNHIDLAACRRRGVRVTSAGDAFSDDVADYAVGLAIDVLRRVSAADRFVRAGSWPVQKEYLLGSKVSGKRVGIVGLGSIGSRVAKRGEIGGAGLDVFEHEPNVPKELLTLDSVVLSPHKAVFTPESFAALEKVVLGNIQAFFSNKPLLTEI